MNKKDLFNWIRISRRIMYLSIITFCLAPIVASNYKEPFTIFGILDSTGITLLVISFIIRYSKWRCPNCDSLINFIWRPFEMHINVCPYCGKKLKFVKKKDSELNLL